MVVVVLVIVVLVVLIVLVVLVVLLVLVVAQRTIAFRSTSQMQWTRQASAVGSAAAVTVPLGW